MTTVSSLPAIPARNSATFGAEFEAVYVALKNNLVPQINAVAGEVNAAAGTAGTDAATAAAAAGAATSAASSAAAAANFKGTWSSLTGALAVPASVAHGGLLWTLLSSVADVTAKTPGVAAEWQRVQFGVLQCVVANTSTPFSSSSTSFVDAGLSASITPKSTASKVLVVAAINNLLASSHEGWAQIHRGASALSNGFIYPVTGTTAARTAIVLDSPATTSATTYSVKAKTTNVSGTIAMSRAGSGPDYILLLEILP